MTLEDDYKQTNSDEDSDEDSDEEEQSNQCKRKQSNQRKLKAQPACKKSKYSTASDDIVTPPVYNETTGTYAPPSAQWIETAKYKVALLKCLTAHCKCVDVEGTALGGTMEKFLSETFMDEGVPIKYDRPFAMLMVALLYKVSGGNCYVVMDAITTLVDKKLFSPESLAKSCGKKLQSVIMKGTGKSLKVIWMIELGQNLVNKHNGEVPVSLTQLLALCGLVDQGIITTVYHEGFGHLYGPSLDCMYGVPVAIALGLIDSAGIDIENPEQITILSVQQSLFTWLETSEWKDFGRLLAGVGGLACLKDYDGLKRIINSKFVRADKDLLLTMISEAREYISLHYCLDYVSS